MKILHDVDAGLTQGPLHRHSVFGSLLAFYFGDTEDEYGPFIVNKYTAPAYFLTALAALCAFCLNFCFNDYKRSAAEGGYEAVDGKEKSEEKKPEKREDMDVRRCRTLGVGSGVGPGVGLGVGWCVGVALDACPSRSCLTLCCTPTPAPTPAPALTLTLTPTPTLAQHCELDRGGLVHPCGTCPQRLYQGIRWRLRDSRCRRGGQHLRLQGGRGDGPLLVHYLSTNKSGCSLDTADRRPPTADHHPQAGYVVSSCGLIGVITLLFMKPIAERFHDTKLMVGGIAVMILRLVLGEYTAAAPSDYHRRRMCPIASSLYGDGLNAAAKSRCSPRSPPSLAF